MTLGTISFIDMVIGLAPLIGPAFLASLGETIETGQVPHLAVGHGIDFAVQVMCQFSLLRFGRIAVYGLAEASPSRATLIYAAISICTALIQLAGTRLSLA